METPAAYGSLFPLWASCQIRTIEGCQCTGKAWNISPLHRGWAIPTCVTHMPWCKPGSLTSGILWSRWRRKRSQHSRRMRNPQFCVSGKRPMGGISTKHNRQPNLSHLEHETLSCFRNAWDTFCLLLFIIRRNTKNSLWLVLPNG